MTSTTKLPIIPNLDQCHKFKWPDSKGIGKVSHSLKTHVLLLTQKLLSSSMYVLCYVLSSAMTSL